MEPPALEQALLDVAARARVTVRTEPFDPRAFPDVDRRGGLCFLDGLPVLLVDARLNVVERIAILVDALSQIELEAITMAPAVRARIDLASDKRADRRRRAIRTVKLAQKRAWPITPKPNDVGDWNTRR